MNIAIYNKLILLIAFIGLSQFCLGSARAEEQRWLVAAVKGGAWKSSDRDPSVRTAVREGDAIGPGDRLETFQQNNVTLTADPAGKNIVTLQGAFRVQQASGATRVRLEHGRALAVLDGLKGQGDFSVATPTGVAAVRGTRFEVEAPHSAMAVRTFQGEVLVSKSAVGRGRPGGASVSLEKGKKVSVSADDPRPLAVDDVSKREWERYREALKGVRAARQALKRDGGYWFEEAMKPARATWVSSGPDSNSDTLKDGQTIVF